MRLVDALYSCRYRTQLLICALIGVMGGLGQTPFDVWPLTMIMLALLFGIIRYAPSAGRAAMLSWAMGTGYLMFSFSWLVEPFLVDAARHGWMAPFALILFSLWMASYWLIVGYVTFKSKGYALAFIATVVLNEAVRTFAFSGFPWAQVGHVLIDTGWLHWSSYGGSLGLTALVAMSGAAIWYAVENNWKTAIGLIALPSVLSALSPMVAPEAPATADAPTIRLVQPNAPQHEKWDPEMIPIFFDRQLSFTAAEPTGPKPDLIVWPETSIPVAFEYATASLSAIAEEAQGTPVIAGIQRFDGESYFNSLIRIVEDGEVTTVYDKHHLVPFGEFMPFGDFLARFGIFGLAATGGYQAGPGPQVIDMGPLGSTLPLICYEGLFPHDVGGYDTRPDFLLMITNDAWFGEFSGPYQHLAQARLRSAEQGLPMIRVANTGVSAIIDATGQVTHSIDLGETGWLDAPLPPALPKTVYARLGDMPIIALTLVLLGLSLVVARKSRV